MKLSSRLWLWIVLCLGALCVFTWFSYSLTAPNLILTSWQPYWEFQTWMWSTFFNNRLLLTQTYTGLLLALLVSYGGLVAELVRQRAKVPSYWLWLLPLLVASPLLISNNALSYDVFNYIFNAKMVVVFEANPHVQTATDFLYDDWTRFMHNTHTPAPYGYGWTALSLVPYYFGFGKFLLTWLWFRLFSFLSFLLLLGTYWYFNTKKIISLPLLWLVVINPLLLLEIISSSHNDLWMMVPALWALALLDHRVQFATSKWMNVCISGLLLALSVSIKLATLTLVPLWLLLLVLPYVKPLRTWFKLWPLLASVLLFVPLLTLRSQQFHPWYLTWVLVWIPLFKDFSAISKVAYKWLHPVKKAWVTGLILLSISSLSRYIPYLLQGNFDGSILWQQKMITWVPFIVVFVLVTLFQIKKAVQSSS